MIPDFDPAAIREIAALLSTPKKIVIVPHAKPDGDAMGSSLGLYNYLIQKNHEAKVVSPTDYPDFLAWMEGNKNVIIHNSKSTQAKDALEEAEIIFCLDFNAADRVEKLEKHLLRSKAKKIMIDHHLSPANFCDFSFTFPDSCATGELVYHFIFQLDGKKYFNKAIAECLYAGIMTDTGSFRFSSMTADTHRVIAELIDAGADNAKIHELIFDNFSADRLHFLGLCLKDKLVVLPEFNTAYISVTKEEMKKYNHLTGDTEGIVNYGLGIKGIRFSAFFSERDDLVKISFRSQGDFSVREIAAEHFEGGGHKNAAGGKSKVSLEETIAKFTALLPQYKEKLTL
ncbi:MAG TPA: bifunctional oligoribonuclease/PAP phosphatase NrnA [Bacteroidia bacterium]|nr:bifunctional oligoribonuclease/PAP phosphatase NrnA [Bacteroidia bacterium]